MEHVFPQKPLPSTKSDGPEPELQTPMKTNASFLRHLAASAVLLLAVATQPSFAQTTATTTPVGFITATVPASPDGGTTPGQLTLSIPLYQSADFAGSVASIDSATQFTLTGANFTFNVATDTHNPRLARVMTGANVGMYLTVTANTATQLTVSTNITGLLSVGDTVQVLLANTIGKVFGSYAFGTTPPLLSTGATATTAGVDNIFILNNNIWGTYFNNGTNWKQSGKLSTFDDFVINPDAGIFVMHYGAAPVSITLTGTIPSTTEEINFIGNGQTFIANRFPVDTTLNSLLGGATGTASLLLPGWVIGTPGNGGDSVFAWNSTNKKWDTYYYDGTNWKKSGVLGTFGNTTGVIPPGTAVVVSRASQTAVALAQTLPYTP